MRSVISILWSDLFGLINFLTEFFKIFVIGGKEMSRMWRKSEKKTTQHYLFPERTRLQNVTISHGRQTVLILRSLGRTVIISDNFIFHREICPK